jgi:Domain of unknown function (DUF4347)
VIAHGSPGRVSFAAGDWSADTVDQEADDLAAIGRALAASGDLRLWSCDTAAGVAGTAFVEHLAQATGADICRRVGRRRAASAPPRAAAAGSSPPAARRTPPRDRR